MSRIWQTLKNTLRGPASSAEVVAAEIKSPVANNPANLDNTLAQTNHTVVNTSDIQDSYDRSRGPLDLNSLKSVKPHIPLIQFRKATNLGVTSSSITDTSPSQQYSEAIDELGVLEWWQLPNKYRRPLIDQFECDVINAGGPEKPWQ